MVKKYVLIDWANLNEHALLKAEYITKVEQLSNQILSNCLLLIQCNYEANPAYHQNINHWKVELRAHMNKCADYKLKKNNTYEKRLKYILHDWIEGVELLSDQKRLNRIIRELNEKENTDIKLTSEFQTILDTMIHRIIELIAEGDTEKISKWLDNLTNILLCQ